jgi:arylformamidase
MAMIDYEAEYNNRALVPEHPDIFNRWGRDAEEYRRVARQAKRADLGLSYGTTERQTIDLFRPAGEDAGALALFIHGGYWRSLEPSMFSHMARGMNAHGVTVAVVGYDLCPRVSVSEIVRQIRQACLFLWQRFGQRTVVTGHSAGGHLAACMVATDWSERDDSAPPDMVPSGVAISGVYDLFPLLTISTNNDLRLTPDEAKKVSPIHWPVGADRALDVVVGGAESAEFRRQSKELVDVWGERGAAVSYTELKGANHFTALDPLSDPESEVVARAVTLAKRLG